MSTEANFVSKMERLFGSDEALGVYFEVEDGGPPISVAEQKLIYNKLGNHTPGLISYLRTGGSAVCCTDYAIQIFLELPGRVRIHGFSNEENPTSRVAREQMHPGGHDFAVVDGRYIVDPWPRLVHGGFTQMVFDLDDEKELVDDIYGPCDCWTLMLESEKHAVEMARMGPHPANQ
jgi:hypothetical protein